MRILLILLALIISGCATTGVDSLSDEAQAVCERVETGQELCGSAARWTFHGSVYKTVNDAHLVSVPPILKLNTYKLFKKKLDEAQGYLEAIDAGQGEDVDQFISVMNEVLRQLVLQGVLTETEAGLL